MRQSTQGHRRFSEESSVQEVGSSRSSTPACSQYHSLEEKLWEESSAEVPTSEFFKAARVAFRPKDGSLNLAKPLPEALLEVLQMDNPDVRLVEKLCKLKQVSKKMKEPQFGWSPLHFAVEKGNVYLMKVLFDARAEANVTCNNKNTVLHLAARRGDAQGVQYLLTKRANKEDDLHDLRLQEESQRKLFQPLNIEAQNLEGWTALNCAAVCGHAEVVSLLLAAEAEVNVADRDGRTPAMNAAKNGHGAALKLLLDASADLNLRDLLNMTVADHAQEFAEMRTAIFALERVNHDLVYAAQCSSTEVVRQALAEGADVNAKDENGWTALTWAVLLGSVEMVRLLAKHGADPDQVLGSSAFFGDELGLNEAGSELRAALEDSLASKRKLLMAARASDWRTVTSELDCGVSVNKKEEETLLTCLMFACISCVPEVVETLAERQADLEQTDRSGWRAAHFAVQAGSPELISLLVSLRADLQAQTFELASVQHIAARADDGGLVQVLLAAACSVNKTDVEGNTPLQLAVKWGSTEAILTLLCCQADPSVVDQSECNLLELAALHGQVHAVEALLNPVVESLPEICEELLSKVKGADAAAPKYALLKHANILHKELQSALRKDQTQNAASAALRSAITKVFDKCLSIPRAQASRKGERGPLMLAAVSRQPDSVKALLRGNASLEVDLVDAAGNTALMMAAIAGNKYSVMHLISYKADITRRNDSDKTALDLTSSATIRRMLITRDMEVQLHNADVAKRKAKKAPKALEPSHPKLGVAHHGPRGSPPGSRRSSLESAVQCGAELDSDGVPHGMRKVWRLRLEGLSLAEQPCDLLDEVEDMLKYQCGIVFKPRKIVVAVDPICMHVPLGYAYLDFDRELEAKEVATHRRIQIAGRRVGFVKLGSKYEPLEESITPAIHWKACKGPLDVYDDDDDMDDEKLASLGR